MPLHRRRGSQTVDGRFSSRIHVGGQRINLYSTQFPDPHLQASRANMGPPTGQYDLRCGCHTRVQGHDINIQVQPMHSSELLSVLRQLVPSHGSTPECDEGEPLFANRAPEGGDAADNLSA